MSAYPSSPSSLPRESRIALLIDADNAPAAKIDLVLSELAKLGVANIRRAYGNWKKNELKGWEAVLHEYAIRPIQQFDVSKGKNATDMLIAIDAMDLLYTDRPDAFGIVSSDADFTPLVMHLRAKGATVYGFGAKKTPAPFVNACSRFLYLEALGGPDDEPALVEAEPEPMPAAPASPPGRKRAGSKSQPVASAAPAAPLLMAPASLPASAATGAGIVKKPAGAELRRDARLVNLLRHAVANCEEDGWSNLSAVRTQIANQAPFDPRNHGFRKFSDLVEAIGLFELDRRGQNIYVREKRGSGGL